MSTEILPNGRGRVKFLTSESGSQRRHFALLTPSRDMEHRADSSRLARFARFGRAFQRALLFAGAAEIDACGRVPRRELSVS
jgi:hypothetical protein